MTIRDIRNNNVPMPALAPTVRPTGTYQGTSVDLQGAGSAVAVIYFGAYTNGTHTPTLEHSDDNVTFTVVSAAEMDGTFSAATASTDANTIQRVGYRGSKRFIRPVITVASGATGAASCALIIKGFLSSLPA